MELDSNSSVSYEWILMICVDKGRSTMLCLELYMGAVAQGIASICICEDTLF